MHCQSRFVMICKQLLVIFSSNKQKVVNSW